MIVWVSALHPISLRIVINVEKFVIPIPIVKMMVVTYCLYNAIHVLRNMKVVVVLNAKTLFICLLNDKLKLEKALIKVKIFSTKAVRELDLDSMKLFKLKK